MWVLLDSRTAKRQSSQTRGCTCHLLYGKCCLHAGLLLLLLVSSAGSSRPLSFQQLLQQHSRVPPTALLELLQQSLSRVQQSSYAGAQVSLNHFSSSVRSNISKPHLQCHTLCYMPPLCLRGGPILGGAESSISNSLHVLCRGSSCPSIQLRQDSSNPTPTALVCRPRSTGHHRRTKLATTLNPKP